MEMQGEEGTEGCHIFRTCLLPPLHENWPRWPRSPLSACWSSSRERVRRAINYPNFRLRGLQIWRLQGFLASPLSPGPFCPCLYKLPRILGNWSPPRSQCGRYMCMAPSGVISGLHLSFHTWGKDEGGAPRAGLYWVRGKREIFEFPWAAARMR